MTAAPYHQQASQHCEKNAATFVRDDVLQDAVGIRKPCMHPYVRVGELAQPPHKAVTQ